MEIGNFEESFVGSNNVSLQLLLVCNHHFNKKKKFRPLNFKDNGMFYS